MEQVEALELLPKEIWGVVFSFLSAREKLKLRMVCKAFAFLAAADSLWEKHCEKSLEEKGDYFYRTVSVRMSQSRTAAVDRMKRKQRLFAKYTWHAETIWTVPVPDTERSREIKEQFERERKKVEEIDSFRNALKVRRLF